ncbi:MAG TPA: hypothetical protein VFP34_10125 [Microlunatus sp.]|nr:hypothetical protein [Microlunatus sp.]
MCEANVCRSPLAGALLDGALSEAGIVGAVRTAGTRALVGLSADRDTVDLAAAQGLDLSGHRARQLDRGLAASSRLLLTASRRTRAQAVAFHPPAVRYAFTIRQLARLLTDPEPGRDPALPTPVGSLDELAGRIDDVRRLAVARRGLRPVDDPDEDDVIDPYGRSAEFHRRALDQLLPALDAISRALGGAAVRPPAGPYAP